MIDLSKIKYRVAVIDENGNQYSISEYIQNLGWEENENEISVRSSFTSRNDNTSKGYLSDIIKPGCLVGIFAGDGAFLNDEVARGYVDTWNPTEKSSGNDLKFTVYDELYHLQKSQDNRYIPSGTGTQAAIQGLLNEWEVMQGEYKGPNVPHGKLKFNNQYLSDILIEILDDAVKLGAEKCILRATKGYTSVIPRGSNEVVYVFHVDNTQSFSHTVSLSSMITRVKVIGQADNEGRSSVEAVVNGETKYGIRQKIYTRGKEETLAAANLAAQAILDDEGKIQSKMNVQGPDVPFIRKGDLVYIQSEVGSGYYYVNGIQHNADSYSMSMSLEMAEDKKQAADGSGDKAAEKKDYKVGDLVNFHGGTHYVSSYPGAKGYSASAGQAKITAKDGSGKAHPWQLIHTDSTSNVYGWVDGGTFD